MARPKKTKKRTNAALLLEMCIRDRYTRVRMGRATGR